MAVSVSTGVMKGRANEVWGTRRVSLFQVTMDTAYPSPGGLAFDPKAFGHQGAVSRVEISPRFNSGANGTFTRRFEYDHTNKKIIGIVTSTGVEVANGVNLSSCVLDITVISD